jgi:hypothetical protein
MNWKSIWAVFAGILFVIIVTTIVDLCVHAAGIYGPKGTPLNNGTATLALAYRIVISIVGAYITAALAPQNPMKHVLILGVIGTLLGAVGAALTWNLGLGPHWYTALVAILAIPQSWVGGKIYESRHRTV